MIEQRDVRGSCPARAKRIVGLLHPGLIQVGCDDGVESRAPQGSRSSCASLERIGEARNAEIGAVADDEGYSAFRKCRRSRREDRDENGNTTAKWTRVITSL